MDFRSMTVKDCFANPKCEAIIKQYAPNLMKYPIKLFNKKTCGEIFDLVVSKKIVPEETAKKIEEAIKAL
jgi:hypothetical protein